MDCWRADPSSAICRSPSSSQTSTRAFTRLPSSDRVSIVTGFSILTVCTGNIHRSPLAAALLGTWAGWYLPPSLAPHVGVRSAGFAAPVGAPMGSHVQTVARALGADGSAHTASQITDGLIAGSNLVLVASRRQRDEVLARVPSALRMTFTMREAGRIAAGLP